MGSERGDGYKMPCSLGEGTGSKESENSEAPQRATASRSVPTHHTIVRKQLVGLVEQRVSDSSILRLIGKWINVGVIEHGRLLQTEEGVPQGQVVSPLLANIYLHHVLDKWFVDEVQPRLKGKAFLIRYVDDAVICFQHEEDAQKVKEVLDKRFSKYGLTLHPEKTRLVEFGRAAFDKGQRMGKAPATFDFLGFTHVCERSLRGKYRPGVRTMKKRLKRGLKGVSDWCKRTRHEPVSKQQEALNAKLRGHYQYYGRSSNSSGICMFHRAVERIWKKWLSRRTRGTPMSWKKFNKLLERYPLLKPEITHTWADVRSPA
jgi:hypothetical protein